MTRWVRAIRHGWVVTAGVPGPDVDEFAEATEVVAALAGPGGGGDTLLAVQHPHRTPRALAEGLSGWLRCQRRGGPWTGCGPARTAR